MVFLEFWLTRVAFCFLIPLLTSSVFLVFIEALLTVEDLNYSQCFSF